MGNTSGVLLGAAQVELGDSLMAEIDVPEAICGGGPEGYRVPPEGLGDPEGLPLEVDLPTGLDTADEVAGSLFNLREHLGE
jgi:hypothetical protein